MRSPINKNKKLCKQRVSTVIRKTIMVLWFRRCAIDASRGITLLDTLVGTALMLVVFLGPATNFGFAEGNGYV